MSRRAGHRRPPHAFHPQTRCERLVGHGRRSTATAELDGGLRPGALWHVQIDGFDWDAGNRDKCETHGLRIADIEAMFRAGARISPDLPHSARETRFIAIGRSVAGRPIFVAFTLRDVSGRRLIRPISARYMHAREARAYEAGT